MVPVIAAQIAQIEPLTRAYSGAKEFMHFQNIKQAPHTGASHARKIANHSITSQSLLSKSELRRIVAEMLG